MVYSDINIKQALEEGIIRITPAPDLTKQLGSCSIDLRLGKNFRVFNNSRVPYIDPRDLSQADSIMTEVEVSDDKPFILQPGDFVLATTMESVTLPDSLLARLEGRSSLGRLGIVVHSTASVFDPGWSGVVVMELGNLGQMPVALYPGMRICALTFEELKTPSSQPYVDKQSAKYAHQASPLASRIGSDT